MLSIPGPAGLNVAGATTPRIPAAIKSSTASREAGKGAPAGVAQQTNSMQPSSVWNGFGDHVATLEGTDEEQ
jgi:anti-sigma factor ChrR (cupin superfamily)